MTEISKADEGGGPAFPVSIPGCGDNGWSGINMRDYFAAQAVAGCGFTDQPKGLAARAYAIADAMLEARKVKP